MWTNLSLCVLLATLCLTAHAYPSNRKKIPNGENVPNPCNLSTIWPGVGHQNVYGSGPRNPFGLDFAANGQVWDVTVCEKDSDGDGKTNGEELGDPDCTWTVGTNLSSSNITISHPGVCEPLDSPVCTVKNSWLKNCGPKRLNCPAINEPGVLNYTLRFPVTPIPAKETTYICHSLVLPWESVADMIAFEPILDNAVILHHMMVLATNEEPKDHPLGESYECTMESTVACRSVIAVWGVGVEGICLNSQVGFRMGPKDFRYAIIQIHWNNPELKTGQTDSSGMRIYYTSKLRPNRGQIATVGQISISIPPGQPQVTVTGNCSGLCTVQLPPPIYITASILHMHTLGKSGVISLRQNGKTIKVLDNVTSYDYNTPTMTEYVTFKVVKQDQFFHHSLIQSIIEASLASLYYYPLRYPALPGILRIAPFPVNLPLSPPSLRPICSLPPFSLSVPSLPPSLPPLPPTVSSTHVFGMFPESFRCRTYSHPI